MKYLFKPNNTETQSEIFKAPATVVGFGIRPDEPEKDDGGMTLELNCGDYVTFERVLTDGSYTVDCKNNIESDGVLESVEVYDEYGELLKLTATNNTVKLDGTGSYRAIYHGNGRIDASVIKE